MRKILGIEQRLRLRWTMHYADGSVRRGVWDCHDGKQACTMASLQPRSGLVFVTIEAKSWETGKIVRVLSVDAGNFSRFYWQHAMASPALIKGKASGGSLIGLGVETFSGNKVTVLFDGKVQGFKADPKAYIRDIEGMALN